MSGGSVVISIIYINVVVSDLCMYVGCGEGRIG